MTAIPASDQLLQTNQLASDEAAAFQVDEEQWQRFVVQNRIAEGERRADRRIVERILDHPEELIESRQVITGVQECSIPSTVKILELLSASLFSFDEALAIVSAETMEVQHMNQAAVLLVQSELEATVPSCTLDELGSIIGEGYNLREEIERSMRWRMVQKTRIDLLSGKHIALVLTPVVVEGKSVACSIAMNDLTEERNKEKLRDDFFSITSHELRTPSIAIAGSAKLLNDFYSGNFPDPMVRDLLDEIERSGNHLVSMVNDVLNMSRLEQGRFTFESSCWYPCQLCSEVIADLHVIAEQRNLKLSFEMPNAIMSVVCGDRERTSQILTNLIGNALKFTKEGGVTLSLCQDGDTMQFRVTDTGEGIPYDRQSSLFNKFRQVGTKDYTLDPNRSSGLGLYISRLMAEGMKGRLILESSEPGKGSTFLLCLPVAD